MAKARINAGAIKHIAAELGIDKPLLPNPSPSKVLADIDARLKKLEGTPVPDPDPDPDPDPTPDPVPTGVVVPGVYTGNGYEASRSGFSGLNNHETLIQRDVDWIVDFVPGDVKHSDRKHGWSPIGDWSSKIAEGRKMMVGIAILWVTDQGQWSSWQEVIDGEWDESFKSAINMCPVGSVVRLGWEMNGTWYRWSSDGVDDGPPLWQTDGGDDNFAHAWVHVWELAQSMGRTDLKWCWNPTLGQQWPQGKKFDADGAYPGDKYVDIVGLDVYDNRWGGDGSEIERWAKLVNQEHGLDFWRIFAAVHGKPLAYPEWGTERNSGLFVTEMFRRFKDEPHHSACYWDVTVGDMDSKLSSNPAAEAAYRAEFVG